VEINHNLRLSLLFELYGTLLTKKQGLILKDFLDFDFSQSEIAEKNNISRQSVNDLVKRSLKTLEEYEDKLQILKKFEKIKIHTNNCLSLVSKDFAQNQAISGELGKLLEVL